MSETERARVGQALDLLRDALSAYVDAAMVKAYGPQWDERVAEENAKHRPDGRKQRVSKNDLAVMLKVIQHERIAPWWNSKTYADPRIRSFASEILTLRNLFSHGNDCINEQVRLLDTASRLLQLLDLPVPGGLEPPDQATTKDPGDGLAIAAPELTPIAIDPFDKEVARLGESGKRLLEMFGRGQELESSLLRQAAELEATVGPGSPEKDIFRNHVLKTMGPEVFDLLAETQRLEADGEGHDSTVLKVLSLAVRCVLLDRPLRDVAENYAKLLLLQSNPALFAIVEGLGLPRKERLAELVAERPREDAIDRVGLLAQMLVQSPSERWRELVRLAQQMNDGDLIPNMLILVGNMSLINQPEDSTIENDDRDEALRLVRDSIPHARMLAGLNPASSAETHLILLLRREGKLCNDLGRPDEATRAFARADEIIDRYPTADPDLVY